MCLWAPLPGQFCSSTRAEVAAGLLALSSPRALSIGTDSACFLKPFLSLINTLWSPGELCKRIESGVITLRPPKPYGLRPNGDLWQLIEQHLIARGPHSVVGFKVKAHTTLSDVEAGNISREDHLGNQRSDAYASRGGRTREYDLYALGAIFSRKHCLFEHVLSRIHVHILWVSNFLTRRGTRLVVDLVHCPSKPIPHPLRALMLP